MPTSFEMIPMWMQILHGKSSGFLLNYQNFNRILTAYHVAYNLIVSRPRYWRPSVLVAALTAQC